MNRRRLAAAVAVLALSPPLTHARRIPPVAFEAEDFAQVRYASGTNDEGVRSLTARVSRWADAAAAEEFRQFVLAGAGSDLPQGEFYQSEPEALALPGDFGEVSVTASRWNTTVGVAAYRTEWVLLGLRHDTLVWDIRISGAAPGPLQDLAASLAADLPSRSLGDDLFRLLPGVDEVPDVLVLDYRMSPDGTFNAEGTPIPEPTAVPN